jgi:endogenous inhibitor of DNA gyrase (YacG/DUF329 family)
MADNVVVLKPVRPCPVCKKPSSQQHHPFCSARCADIDLNRWLSGTYVIPAEPVAEDENESGVPDADAEDDEV